MVDTVQDKLDYFISLLSSDELIRANRFRFEKHRKRFIISHGFKRSVLTKYLNIDPVNLDFITGNNGKPYVTRLLSSQTNGTLNNSQLLQFNLTHTEDITLLAVTKGAELGIDIEFMDRKTDWQGISRRFFTQAEQKALFSLQQTLQKQAFYQLWTRKEAYIKLLGYGLSLSPDKFTLTVPPLPPALMEHNSNKYQKPQQVEFISVKLPDNLTSYCATLACSALISEYYFHQYR